MNLNSTITGHKDSDPNSDVSMDCSRISNQSPPPNYVTYRDGKAGNCDIGTFDMKLQAMQDTLMKALHGLFSEQRAELNKEFDDDKKSLMYFNEKFEDMAAKSLQCEKRVCIIEEKITVIDKHNTRICDLEAKIDSLEQHARQCNVEIGNLPEKNAENLTEIILKIGALIKITIAASDIVTVHRVAQAKKEGSQPKKIIVKFATRNLRDNFRAAARRTRGFTSEKINISGTPHIIYINDHLTLKAKILFRQTRIAAKECGYRFVWPKNGNILVRQKETSPVFAIKNVEDIHKKIKQKNAN